MKETKRYGLIYFRQMSSQSLPGYAGQSQTVAVRLIYLIALAVTIRHIRIISKTEWDL